MNNIKIICDSLSDVNKEYLEQYDIDVVPLTLILDGKEYRDSIDISPEEFYKILREENAYPKTSQATYAQFKEVFEKYIKEGKKVLYISGSSAATGTCQSAIMAKNDTEGEIYIYDTYSLSFGAGLLVVKAAEMIRSTDKKCSIIFLTAFDEFNYAVKEINYKNYLPKDDEYIFILGLIEILCFISSCESSFKSGISFETSFSSY